MWIECEASELVDKKNTAAHVAICLQLPSIATHQPDADGDPVTTSELIPSDPNGPRLIVRNAIRRLVALAVLSLAFAVVIVWMFSETFAEHARVLAIVATTAICIGSIISSVTKTSAVRRFAIQLSAVSLAFGFGLVIAGVPILDVAR